MDAVGDANQNHLGRACAAFFDSQDRRIELLGIQLVRNLDGQRSGRRTGSGGGARGLLHSSNLQLNRNRTLDKIGGESTIRESTAALLRNLVAAAGKAE